MSAHERSRPDDARAALEAARRDVARHLADTERAAAALALIARRAPREDPARRQAEGDHAQRVEQLRDARIAERTAGAEFAGVLSGWLPEEPGAEVERLDASHPIVLLPIRVETRFHRDTPPTLRVRIYPDAIAADTHEPALTGAERDAGVAFWRRAWDPAGEPEVWRALVARYGAPRAAWIVRATTPVNLAARPAAPPEFPPTESRPGTWSRPAESRVLPDRWIVLTYRGGALVHRAASRPVADVLALSLAPYRDKDDRVDVSGDGLRVDEAVAWTVDYDRAVTAGMAVTIQLGAEDLQHGFDRLLVLGVKASLDAAQAGARLAELLDAHHYTRGLGIVPQGTPTNNSSAGPSAFPPEDRGAARSFAVERGAPLAAEGSDGSLLMRALGVPPEVAAHVAGAERLEQQSAGAMNNALWPATLGYFLEQMMAPVFTPEAIQIGRRHFVQHVRGRGPLPAFRVGSVPYGVLPVLSLDRWQEPGDADAIDRHLPGELRHLRGTWAVQVGSVPRVGRTADPDADLSAVLAMDASAREVRVRSALGPDLQQNLLAFLAVDDADADGQPTWLDQQRFLAILALTALGHPEWSPRIAWLTFADTAYLYSAPLVAPPPLSEARSLSPSYIRWIRSASVGDLRFHRLVGARPPSGALLYDMLRHSALAEYRRLADGMLVKYGLATEAELYEAEMVAVAPGTEQRRTVWQRLETPVPAVTGTASVGEYLLSAARTPDTAPVADYRTSLRMLEELPSAELERLFTETLDTCSHRLDAWITSLADKRLRAMRRSRPLGAHLGAYGWVEDLRARPADQRPRRRLPDERDVMIQPGNGGYIHAPSMTHAAAAAILRNAYLTRRGTAREQFALNLSSRRVRDARGLLDAVRLGQPLGAILGYRLERGLHERSLDRYIEPLRTLFPLVANKIADSGEPAERVAARSVVDGLALVRKWRQASRGRGDPWANPTIPATGADRTAIEAEIAGLDDALDAVGDLLTAEAVYQIVRGSAAGAAASLDALGKGMALPDPEIARQPRGGIAITHRVGIVLGGAPLAADDDPWRAILPTPRSRVEPWLDAWAGRLLGDPATVRCRVTHPAPTAEDPDHRATVEVMLADLGLRPLDLLTLVQGAELGAAASELDARIVDRAALPPGATEVRVLYGRAESWGRGAVRTFPEILEVALALRSVVGGARPLGPEDLVTPDAAADVPAASRMADDAELRAQGAVHELNTVRDELAVTIAAVRTAPPAPAPDLEPLRRALRAGALLGVSGALPAPDAGRDATLTQADRTLAALDGRRDEARRIQEAVDDRVAQALATDPGADASRPRVRAAADRCQAVFGRDFVFLPRFRPSGAAELDLALAAAPALVGEPTAPLRWIQGAARVQPGLARWRKLTLYAGAMGAPRAPLDVVQIPYADGARWIALPFAPRHPHRAGRVSIVLERPATPAPDAPWVGLLLDEWNEMIPGESEVTGITFHYDDPGAEAPQAVLIAVPPARAERWDLASLVAVLQETLDLAKLRAVDGELLGALGQFLPAAYLADNPDEATISTDLGDQRVHEATVERRQD